MIAFDQSVFMDWISAAGLKLVKPVRLGHWCGEERDGRPDFQDVLVLENA